MKTTLNYELGQPYCSPETETANAWDRIKDGGGSRLIYDPLNDVMLALADVAKRLAAIEELFTRYNMWPPK